MTTYRRALTIDIPKAGEHPLYRSAIDLSYAVEMGWSRALLEPLARRLRDDVEKYIGPGIDGFIRDE